MKTGFNKHSKRIARSGRLKDKKGAMKAKAPSFTQFKDDISKIKSPYSRKMERFGNETGVKYGRDERMKRSRKRIDTLAGKLNPSTNPIGSIASRRSGYGSKGADLIKKVSKRARDNNFQGD